MSQHGYGVTDLRTLPAKSTSTPNFRLASLTKQFTAMAIMLLVHDRKLALRRIADRSLPGIPAYGKSVTIREILNHTSGLLDYEDLMAKQYGNTPDDQIPQISDAGVLALMEKASHHLTSQAQVAVQQLRILRARHRSSRRQSHGKSYTDFLK